MADPWEFESAPEPSRYSPASTPCFYHSRDRSRARLGTDESPTAGKIWEPRKCWRQTVQPSVLGTPTFLHSAQRHQCDIAKPIAPHNADVGGPGRRVVDHG